MNFSSIASFFRRSPKQSQRGYREVAALGGQNSDWPVSHLSEDSDVWQNAWALTSRVRDLFRTTPEYQSYRETLWANNFGSEGIVLQMQIKENEDRIIYSAEEKHAIECFEGKRNRIRQFVAKREGREFEPYSLTRSFGTNGSRAAKIKIGEPDVYANELIEKKWKEWQREENCDVRGTRNYHTIRQIRLISAVRDGDFFIRLIRNKRVNKFGITLQMINSEWCDRFFNATLGNGNVVRMGIEYEFTEWGLGKVVAYYFIKRQPQDWQFSSSAAFNFGNGSLHDRIDARDIIHYARPVDADSTRPAPWVASTVPKARQLDQYALAEVIAARAQACKTGWLYSDVVPEGGVIEAPNPRGVTSINTEPGGIYGLPYGVKYQSNDPTHPNGNFENFRKGMLRSQCAGMPGSNYSTLANDYEAINFSAGRLQRLDTNELNKMIQQFDIDKAEVPIFEAWLEMSLLTGAIPLPLAKYDKFNKPKFTGRRWQGVDPVKDNTASALAVANKFSSRTRECAERGIDFRENLEQLAQEQMDIEEYGLNPETTVEKPPIQETPMGEGRNPDGSFAPNPDSSNGTTPKKPKKQKAGARFEIAE